MSAIKYRMPYGIPGDLSRQAQATIESKILGSTAFTAYGLPAKISSNTIIPAGAGAVAADIVGFLVRPFPTMGANASDPLGTAVPPTSGIGNLLKRGYIIVKCNNGTPADGGAVYMRVLNPSGAKVVGGLEATADGSNTITLSNCVWSGQQDSNGNVEIAFNI